MAINYQPPGVNVIEYTSAAVAPLIATSDAVCLVGPTSGAITVTDTIQLNGTTATTLPTVPSTATMVAGAYGTGSIISVTAVDTAAAQTANQSNAYNVSSGYDYTAITYSATNHTIARVASPSGVASIPDGSYVYVTYSYTPVDYWLPQKFDNMSDVEARFGTKFDSTNTTISSPLSLAAQIAFENGATSVILQPLFYNNSGTYQRPTDAQAVNPATWTSTLTSLRDVDGIGTIVPVVGQAKLYGRGSGTAQELTDAALVSIFQTVQDHIYYQQANNDQYIVGIFGEDGTDTGGTYAARATIQSHASTLQARYNGTYNQNMVLVSVSKFQRPLTSGTGQLNLGGQYAAAAIAGMVASRKVSSTLTRKNVVGFSNITDVRTKQQKNEDSSKGLFVIEQKGAAIQVRHSLTLDINSVDRSELSVVRAKHKVINSLRLTVDTQIIGQIVADNNAPLIIASAIGGTLSTMVDDGDIVSFSDVQAKTLSLNPTVIEVRFNYRPAFPINYINIGFSIDLSSGNLTLGDTTNQINSGALNG
jgi:hypothetical protein